MSSILYNDDPSTLLEKDGSWAIEFWNSTRFRVKMRFVLLRAQSVPSLHLASTSFGKMSSWCWPCAEGVNHRNIPSLCHLLGVASRMNLSASLAIGKLSLDPM
jgi:hypothetical protein